MSTATQTCHALVVGISGYDAMFFRLERSLPRFFQERGISFDLDYIFFYEPHQAWKNAQGRRHDIFFIDGTLDNPVRGHSFLSSCIREYAPSVPLIGMSQDAGYLRQERHLYDRVLHFNDLQTPGSIANLLLELGLVTRGD